MRELVDESTENGEKRDIVFGACHHNLKKILHLASEFNDVRILPSHFPTLGSENVFILHQKMREMSQKMRELVDESTENGEKRDILFGACHHNLMKILHVASEFDSVFNLSPTSQRCSTFDQQLCWCTFVSNHRGRIELKRHLHMSMSSFDKLLSYIRTSLKVDSDMAQL